MGNFKEIGQTIVQFAKTEAAGVSFDLQRNNYQGAARRVLVGIPHDFKSFINELQDNGAQHRFNYDQIVDRRNRIDFIDPGYGSLRMMLANFYLDRRSKNDIEGKKIARFHYKHQDALINAVFSLTDGQSLAVLLPHGLNVNAGVAAAIFTHKEGKIEAYSRLLPETNEQQAKDLFSHLAEIGGQTINLGNNENDSALWTGVMTESNNLDFIKDKEVFDDFLTGIFGQDFLKGKVMKCLDGGSCSTAGGQAVNQELKTLVPAMALAGAGGGMGGGGGGSGSTEIISANGFPEKEASMLPVLSAPALFLAASLPTSALAITQSVVPEVLFTTALHSTVANDHDDLLSPVLFEPVPLIPAAEQSLRETEKPLFILDHAIPPARIIPVVSKTEPVSMFQVIERDAERVKPVFKEESAQVQKTAAEKPAADKPVNLATLKAEFEQTLITKAFFFAAAESNQLPAGREARETKKAWQAETENIVNQLRMKEQQVVSEVVSEKAVKELSLPLLEIAPETAPVMALRVELKPVVKADEVEKAVDDKMILVDNQPSTARKKKVEVEVDQEQSKLFLVENFSVNYGQAIKKQEAQPLRLKKIFWQIKTSESDAAGVSLLELELPKDQNQRLYAFYHFLQKVVKKVVGQDAIRTRQVTVIAEKEDVDLNLELVLEIKYYLELLKSKGKSHAQAFAFAD